MPYYILIIIINCRNVSSVLDESMKQTNNEAEIMAAVVALRLAKRKSINNLFYTVFVIFIVVNLVIVFSFRDGQVDGPH